MPVLAFPERDSTTADAGCRSCSSQQTSVRTSPTTRKTLGLCAVTPPFPEPERWLPVPGWEGLYEVSDLGRVRSLPRPGGNNRLYGGKLLKPHVHKGYPMVPSAGGGERTMTQVHRLVLEAFTGPCPAEIRSRYSAGLKGSGPRVTHEQLASQYGVCRPHVTCIINWRARAG